jgi:micrococcal nuclease
VVDGDTIHVSVGGRDYRVRYIGIDAPEIEPTVQRMGLEASAENAKLVAGKTVVLERDVSETDRYGRLLRYIWIRQGSGWLFVNRELVRLGFAASTAYPPDVKYQSVFDAAQRQAQAAKLGLWAAAPLPFAGGSAKANCDAAYPTVCIPPPPPDLDCSDITFRRFKVLPPDPHHFDSDHDGIGCESG